jgi:competence protein ComEA
MPESRTVPATIVVHVAGEVQVPGVYVLDGTPRVHEAIERAGGPTDDADLDALNLAQPLLDGQRLYLPARGAVDPATITVLTPGPTMSGGDVALDGPSPGPVDLNRATAEELEALPGVGPSTAAAIIDDRERNGPFATVDDLDRVSGIGPAKLAALADLVTV